MSNEKHEYPTSAVHRVIKTSWPTPSIGISPVPRQSAPAAANSSATGTLYSNLKSHHFSNQVCVTPHRSENTGAQTFLSEGLKLHVASANLGPGLLLHLTLKAGRYSLEFDRVCGRSV